MHSAVIDNYPLHRRDQLHVEAWRRRPRARTSPRRDASYCVCVCVSSPPPHLCCLCCASCPLPICAVLSVLSLVSAMLEQQPRA